MALANATSVHFGAIAATIVSDSSTTIVVTSPLAQTAGSLDVTVTTARGNLADLAGRQVHLLRRTDHHNDSAGQRHRHE